MPQPNQSRPRDTQTPPAKPITWRDKQKSANRTDIKLKVPPPGRPAKYPKTEDRPNERATEDNSTFGLKDPSFWK